MNPGFYPFYEQVAEKARSAESREKSVSYLADKLTGFVCKWEKVLVFVYSDGADSIGALFADAIRKCGAEPVFPTDFRWKTLLYVAFSSRAETVIGLPMTILGLAKLARYSNVPLSIRNVVLCGYPCPNWMIDGITKLLDSKVFQCFAPSNWPFVGGFSCLEYGHLHLRDSEYRVEIVDEYDKPVAQGERGYPVISSIGNPAGRMCLPLEAKLGVLPCGCGEQSSYFACVYSEINQDATLSDLTRNMLLWTSILDCRLERTESGLSLEIVVFSGEKLPKLPSCARLVVHGWVSATDIPFELQK